MVKVEYFYIYVYASVCIYTQGIAVQRNPPNLRVIGLDESDEPEPR